MVTEWNFSLLVLLIPTINSFLLLAGIVFLHKIIREIRSLRDGGDSVVIRMLREDRAEVANHYRQVSELYVAAKAILDKLSEEVCK